MTASEQRLKPQKPEFGPELPKDPMQRLVHFARLAPSTHNSQPWRFVIERDAVDVFADFGRWMQVADRDRRQLHLSLGCALESLLIAADYEGLGTEVRYFPVPADESYVCRVAVRAGGAKREDAAAALLHAVPTRHTSHQLFDAAKPVGAEDRARLANAVTGEGIALHFADSAEAKEAVAGLLHTAETTMFADPEYRRDIGRWLEAGPFGKQWLLARLSEIGAARVPAARQILNAELERVQSAPLLALLTSRRDGRIDQLRAGQAYLRVALVAERNGLRCQPQSALLERPESRAQVAHLFGAGERSAQHLFRLGCAAPEAVRTRRRALKDVMVGGGLSR